MSESASRIVGWDIGGAHLKAAVIDREGRALHVAQRPCPLWQGLEPLHTAVDEVLAMMPASKDALHAVTMTGELVDFFSNRREGVRSLIGVIGERLPIVRVFAGDGFLDPAGLQDDDIPRIASANWLATARYTATRIDSALLIDIGSTTTDLLLIHDNQVKTFGHTDYDRLRCGELLYTGVVRTPVIAITERVPFEGEWLSLMTENFATSADVYRLSGELPEYADQMPAADGGEKTLTASARRIARMLGRDVESASFEQWREAARFIRERQVIRIWMACQRQLSRCALPAHAPLIGAGIGRFLLAPLAARLGRSCSNFSDLLPEKMPPDAFQIADCAPAVAVAYLARQALGRE
jgi:probable H4MPT-linked C1 transfer pathway protein